jgi:hypothetical protein
MRSRCRHGWSLLPDKARRDTSLYTISGASR